MRGPVESILSLRGFSLSSYLIGTLGRCITGMKTSTLTLVSVLALSLVGCGGSSSTVETPWIGAYNGSLHTQMQDPANPTLDSTTQDFTLFVDSFGGSAYLQTDFGCTLVFVPKSDTEAVAIPTSCTTEEEATQTWEFSTATMVRVKGKVSFTATATLTYPDGSGPLVVTYTFTEK